MWGMVGGMDGDLIDRYGGEEAAIAYQKQKILAEKQGKVFDMAPAAWKRQYFGEEAPAKDTGNKVPPSQRMGSEKAKDPQEKKSTGLLTPKPRDDGTLSGMVSSMYADAKENISEFGPNISRQADQKAAERMAPALDDAYKTVAIDKKPLSESQKNTLKAIATSRFGTEEMKKAAQQILAASK
jgi:hypothetical protein